MAPVYCKDRSVIFSGQLLENFYGCNSLHFKLKTECTVKGDGQPKTNFKHAAKLDACGRSSTQESDMD